MKELTSNGNDKKQVREQEKEKEEVRQKQGKDKRTIDVTN